MTVPAPDVESTDAYDFIVVGGGSAGCVLAGRLAESGHHSVLLLEAGEHPREHPETLSADGFKDAFAKEPLMWHRMSEPQNACGTRSLYLGSGHVLGGSGAVNGMVYTRGDRHDFSAWPPGWRWDEIEATYIALEKRLLPRSRPATAFTSICVQAATQAGLRHKNGLNDGQLNACVGYNAMNYQADRRQHSYRAFIADAPGDRLHVLTEAATERIEIDETHRARAVLVRRNGHLRRYRARRQIILCAGALETPKLLMLSGIGPRQQVQEHGLPCLIDAPGVGENLQDHPNVCLFYRCRKAVDFAYPQIYAFARANPALSLPPDAPDSCYVFYAAAASLRQSMQRMLPILALPGRWYRVKLLRRLLRLLIDGAFLLPPVQAYLRGVFGIVVILGKPVSRGRIRLASANPQIPACIDPAYYRDDTDRKTLLAAIEKARAIADSPALRSAGTRALSSGARSTSRNNIWRWAQKATMTTFHYCGSCRMGSDDMSPVDSKLRVKGVSGLRVADASVMPEIPVSALNAPSMMIAYRAADIILAEEFA